MPSLYTFTDYSPDWPLEFEREAQRLQTLLPDLLESLHHVGSTSVPGLAAKPVIDLIPVLRDAAAMDSLIAPLEAAGYRSWGEYGLPGRRYFTRDHGNVRTHNLHCYPAGHSEIERHLAFCAYLRAHSAVAAEYEALKRAVYAMHPADIDRYNDGKNDWIKRMEPVAIAWLREQGR